MTFQTSFRGQPPWRLRERLILQAINKTIELEALYICNAKFERIGFQWEAMYGTAVGSFDWKNNTEEYNKDNTTNVPELPDYYDDDGSGSSATETTLNYSTSPITENVLNSSARFYNSTVHLDDNNENDNTDSTTGIDLIQSTTNDSITFV